MDSLGRFLLDAGPFAIVITAVLCVALAAMAERAYFYYAVCRRERSDLVETITEFVGRDDVAGALQHLRSRDTPLHRVLLAALKPYRDRLGLSSVEDAIEAAAAREVPRLHKRLDYLSTCANVATLAGLLGTIFGLQQSFASLSAADPLEKASLLAAGVSQAMNTTAFGLLVAIPCMAAHAWLSSRRTALLDQVEESCLRLLARLRDLDSTASQRGPRLMASTAAPGSTRAGKEVR